MMQTFDKINLLESDLVPDIVKDYLNQHENLKEFTNTWHNAANWEYLISQRSYSNELRSVLQQSLQANYKKSQVNLDEQSQVYKNIQLLGEPNTFVITTGHQLSLFGGTLFMAYKILTAIKIAKDLGEKFPQQNFVPLFWMASEDHDFEEIRSTYIFGKNIVWEKDSHNKPTGHLDTQGLELVVSQIQEVLGDSPIAKNWIEKIQQAYLSQANLANASTKFYHELFGHLGLVILDPDDLALKQQLIPIIKADLIDGKSYQAQLASDKVLEKNYKLQIHARPCNFFYLSSKHGRKLIRRNNDQWEYDGMASPWNQEDLEKEIQENPHLFSPNVNLRPVYQELILPNLAYVGGPAECAYWLQLKSVFTIHNQKFPKIVLRFMQTIYGKGLREKVEKLGLQASDLLLPEKDLLEKLIQQRNPYNFHLKFEETLNLMQEIVDQSRVIEPILGKDFLEAKLKLKDLFKSKSGAIKKAMESSEQASLDKLLKLRARIYPDGILQERIETLLQFEVSAERDLKNELLDLNEPLNGTSVLSEL